MSVTSPLGPADETNRSFWATFRGREQPVRVLTAEIQSKEQQ